jgi:hypothetical protein
LLGKAVISLKPPLTYPASMRKPMRITITVSFSTHKALIRQSDEEGRSLSNLAAYLIERSLSDFNH